MSHRVRPVKGTRVLLPEEAELWAEVEAIARRVFGSYGFGEIRTPILEHTELFVRSVGEETDIVGKEMYSFADRKGRELSLRPEGTAPVVRALIDEGIGSMPLPQRYWYVGPYFRYERPQKGRYRQFHQIGAEIVGDIGPLADAELITMLMRFLGELGHRDLEVQINTVGDAESRRAFRDALVGYLEPHREDLSEDSQRRLETNPLRILDSKAARDREILAASPSLQSCLSDASREHFEQVVAALEAQGIAVSRRESLVRGLDYYTRTVFEIVSAELGAQDALVGGGRYDQLVGELGGPDVPAIGFAIGEDRLIETIPIDSPLGRGRQIDAMVVPIGAQSGPEALRLAEELRRAGLRILLDSPERGVGKSLKHADRLEIGRVVLLGEEEISQGQATIKDLLSGAQTTLPRAELVERLAELEPGEMP